MSELIRRSRRSSSDEGCGHTARLASCRPSSCGATSRRPAPAAFGPVATRWRRSRTPETDATGSRSGSTGRSRPTRLPGARLPPRRRLGRREPRLPRRDRPRARARAPTVVAIAGRLPPRARAPVSGRGSRTRCPRRDGCSTTPPSSGSIPARIAVGGDSSGATLAAVVARRLPVERQVLQLCLPVTDHRFDTDSYVALRRGLLPHARGDALVLGAVPGRDDGPSPDASPLRATELGGVAAGDRPRRRLRPAPRRGARLRARSSRRRASRSPCSATTG